MIRFIVPVFWFCLSALTSYMSIYEVSGDIFWFVFGLGVLHFVVGVIETIRMINN
jgi:hypothetical protein